MSDLRKLNFPSIKLRAREHAGLVEVWDELRAMWLVLTPEEWVRRHLVAYLVSDCGVFAGRIAQEYPVALNGQPQRADVVVVDNGGSPLLLAECKAPDIPIDRHTFAQAVRYNSVLGARFIILTNGLKHRCFEYEEGEYAALAAFPVIDS